jgi:DNA-binding MurR/RpiR family transcriptional regulator
MDETVTEQDQVGVVPHNTNLKIQSLYHVLKTAERKAVDFLLSQPQRVSQLTIVDFAAEAGCSEATIVRLAKRLGYDGFPQLKSDFAQANRPGAADHDMHYEGLKKSDAPFTVFEKVVQSTTAALNDSVDIMDRTQYERAVQAIVDCEQLMFCGLGDAAVVALEGHARFVRMGKRALASLDPDIQLMHAAQLKKGDVLIALSHSGRSRTVVDTAKRANASGATVIAITNFPISPLAKRSDIVLQTAIFTKYMNTEVISKRVAELCILESLSVNYLVHKGDDAINRLAESDQVVDVNKL